MWVDGIFCTLGKQKFFPEVIVEIEGYEEDIPFREINKLMIYVEMSFEKASEFLCEQIMKKYQCSKVKVTVGGEDFSAWTEMMI